PLWRISLWSRARAMGKRLLCLLLLLLYLPSAALATPVAGVRSALDEVATSIARQGVRELAACLLADFDPANARRNSPIRLYEGYLHENGFGFLIPKGYEMLLRYKGTAVTLVDATQEEAPQRTSIAVRVTGVDDGLSKLTAQQISTAYAGQFQRFSLLDFSRGELHEVECLRITFICGEATQMLVRQLLFNKGGRCYIITLTMENRVDRVLKGMADLDTFCDSLLFATTTDRRTSR
ncbi:hypothetical protein LJC74_10430, partial [Eubacteriales bacterium OttesenSCG-928-A19]|nr:hypothetical protein [Eubacteriales bacterium OttesenSCG-928-A19]